MARTTAAVLTVLAAAGAAGAQVTVTVDASVRYQRMDGFGASERVWDDPHLTNSWNPATQRAKVVIPGSAREAILDDLYDDLKLTRVRPTTEGLGIEPSNDNGDPLVTDLSKFNFGWKRNDAHIDFVKQAMARGVRTYFLSPVQLETWMTESNPSEYVEWAMAILRRWRARGLTMPYYSVINEPGYRRSGYWSGNYIRSVIRHMGPKLRAEGFPTKFVIPDDLNASQAYDRSRTILADPEARRYVGALACHLYDEPVSNMAKMKELSERYGLPLWMTEFSKPGDPFGWANLMHTLIANYGVSAVDYMWGFFGQQDRAQLISIRHDGSSYLGYDRRKQYYVTGQWSRFVPPGARRIRAASSDGAVRVSAFLTGSRPVLVAVNNSTGAKTIRVSVRGVDGLTAMVPVRTTASENWRRMPELAVRDGAFTVTLAPTSVTTFAVPAYPTLSPLAFRTTATVNVRTGPGPGYAIRGTAPAGRAYVADAAANGWRRIFYGGGYGWVGGTNLAHATGLTGVKVAVSDLNVRSGPANTYRIVGTAHVPEIYIRVAESDGYSRIQWTGSTAWVKSVYTRGVSF